MLAQGKATFVCIATLTACAAWPVRAADGGPVAEVRSVEAAQVKAVLRKDMATLTMLWSEAMHVNAPDNKVRDRNSVFGAMRAGLLDYSAYEQSIEFVDVKGDVATVMGQEMVRPLHGTNVGKTVQRRFTDIWYREAAGWQQISRQATEISVGL